VGDGLKVPKSGREDACGQASASGIRFQHKTGIYYRPFLSGCCGSGKGPSKRLCRASCKSAFMKGWVFSNRGFKNLLDKMLLLVDCLGLPLFTSSPMPTIRPEKSWQAFFGRIPSGISSANHSRCVFCRLMLHPGKRRKGRPKQYGEKIPLKTLFDCSGRYARGRKARSMGNVGFGFGIVALDLLIKRLGIPVRFVAVIHPVRGRCILMCTDLSLPPLEIIRIYGLRFKIEGLFQTGPPNCRLLCLSLLDEAYDPLRRSSGDQFLHRKLRSLSKCRQKKNECVSPFYSDRPCRSRAAPISVQDGLDFFRLLASHYPPRGFPHRIRLFPCTEKFLPRFSAIFPS